jgi:hypothetical protein
MDLIAKRILFYLVVMFILKNDANGHSLVAKKFQLGNKLESK